jgi:superfamily II RNA helicase
MVKICNIPYNETDNCKNYDEYFNEFSFPLSDFQKYAIEGIVNEQHVLVTAHTGSGKTLPAEFAIKYLVNKGKKVIYTSPIKALSNQKYSEFTKAFPDISFGILTGDIKFNPEADVLIMTTEILQNTLYLRSKDSEEKSKLLMFEMDLENDLACVIFDEIHYINDQDRGKVWEETIMMLPEHVQMLMLSATIDKPDKFAAWCEEQKGKKEVYLASTEHRVVPLHHHLFVTSPEHLYKQINDKSEKESLRKEMDKLLPIRTPKNNYIEESYLTSKRLLEKITKHKTFISPNYVLNKVVKYCKENEMLPAITFVFSRKNVEKYANNIGETVVDDMFPVPEVIEKECEHIIRKIPNYKEYLQLPEYLKMVKLITKGIAIHHSGILPILREMVEIMFAKGFIKLLFATETFAVGLNMPTKTVIFTSVSKFTNEQVRYLYSHEYTQMAGRAGRRGLDKIGHVIHCVNMYRNTPSSIEFKKLLSGIPQTLVSKFVISPTLILNIFQTFNENSKTNIEQYINKSMLFDKIKQEINGLYISKEEIENQIKNKYNSFTIFNCSEETIEQYIELKKSIPSLKNKKRKQAIRDMESIESTIHKKPNVVIETYESYLKLKSELKKLNNIIEDTSNYVNDSINYNINELVKLDCLEKIDEEYKITLFGELSAKIKEGPGILICYELYWNANILNFSLGEIVGFLSIFTPIKVNEDCKLQTPNIDNDRLNDFIVNVKNMYYSKYENLYPNEFQYDIIQETMDWVNAETEIECKQILYTLENEKQVFLGEFVKALLKINHISLELETVANLLGNVQLANIFNTIPKKTLKYVATNQSLYV